MQVDYTKTKKTRQDDVHKDRFFDWGYIGQFNTSKSRSYALVSNDKDNILDSTYYDQVAWSDTLVTFNTDAFGDLNPLASNYTSEYYNLSPTEPQTESQIEQGLGYVNGTRSNSLIVYGLWHNTGRKFNGFYNMDNSQFRVSGNFSADIKNHAIKAGFEWEKRDDRYWAISPIGLWKLAKQLTNQQITQLDTTSNLVSGPILVGSTVVSNPAYPVYSHPYIVDLESQSTFDKNLRAQLGVANDVWIDIDSYDPNTFSIDMFSADELLNFYSTGGFSYYGYDYKGKKLSGKPAFTLDALEKFYKGGVAGDKSDMDGTNKMRTVPSFTPVYTAGYIQDNFDIKDMKFNIGVRIDHFNANQPVLKDKYLLYEAYTIGEDLKFEHPSNLADNAVVYVDDSKNPTTALGYRIGDTWYNSLGVQITDPELIAKQTGSGTIQPYLKYPNEKTFLDSSSVSNVFEMYDKQTTFMPRIAFNFPISDRADFVAHYDVLTQRPPAYNRFDPTNYLYIQTVGGVLNNPALKPERTTDYEVGFRQVLSERKNASLMLSAFYREMRNMIQQVKVLDAYPKTYNSFDNIDFGTVKGFTVAYDLRRTGNVQMTASYTLQFAEGTGSASNTAGGVLESGQPNLRTTMPLDFDQRHAVVLNTDYRFGSGKDYRGPTASWAKMIFENFGGNVVFRVGSGLPYTRQKNVTSGNGDNSSAVIFTQNQRTSLKGKINGSNLPWQYRMDLRIDKNIPLTFGKGEDKGKVSNLNVYIQILNVLNTKNVINLYRYTGDADDDGYLSAPENQNGIQGQISEDAFRELYAAKMAHPDHYSIPRRIRIGVTLDF